MLKASNITVIPSNNLYTFIPSNNLMIPMEGCYENENYDCFVLALGTGVMVW